MVGNSADSSPFSPQNRTLCWYRDQAASVRLDRFVPFRRPAQDLRARQIGERLCMLSIVTTRS